MMLLRTFSLGVETSSKQAWVDSRDRDTESCEKRGGRRSGQIVSFRNFVEENVHLSQISITGKGLNRFGGSAPLLGSHLCS